MPNLNDLKVGSLRLLKVLVEEGSTQKAATKLNLSQSGVSYELKKLREIFDDSLFIRSREGLVPNDKTLRLYPQISEVLGAVEHLYNSKEEFNPTDYVGQVNIAVIEPMAVGLIPRLFERLHHQAPGLELSFSTWTSETLDKLRQDDLDFAVHNFVPDDPMITSEALGPAQRLMACRPHHPILRRRNITLMDLCQYPWVVQQVYNPNRSKNIIEVVSEQKRLFPKVVARADYLPALVNIIERGNALLYTSQVGLSAFQDRLVLFHGPKELEQVKSIHYGIYPASHQNSAFHQWLCQEVKATLEQVQAEAEHMVMPRQN
ncbi:LysR family transcriptional regulator [Ferrimonas lipolytica]|uniref:LysR family transcriptional regulator n=1 Tax=Ferrimonas lipolytica TaxID=2724191 RepID=A0A6H1UGA2_9GAMM|nr:LysR family transcriptional regulator [Ferrimonas lipolytica]QIZ78135.1 LysR family transcriptional regulator [Ferrimonas lipolytica]